MLQEWWLRPVNSAMRVGEHKAVVWKRLYFRPFLASFSALGMWTGPPNALDWPKPMSSINTMTMFGAPLGGLTSKRGGALALRASRSVIVLMAGSGIGRTLPLPPVLSRGCAAGEWPLAHARDFCSQK